MTLIVGKNCSDGVLLVADSCARHTDGTITNDGVKWHCGFRQNEPFALVFGGFAASDKNPSITLDALKAACAVPTGSIQDNVRDAAQRLLRDEVNHGQWEDEAEREHFRRNGVIIVLLSVRSYELCLILMTAQEIKIFQSVEKNRMVMGEIDTDHGTSEKLADLRNHSPQSVKEAFGSAAQLFQIASELLPNDVKYPGKVFVHRAGGVSEFGFTTAAEAQSVLGSI